VTGDLEKGFTITNTKDVPQYPMEPGTTKVSVEKVWKGEKQDSVTVKLLADGEQVDTIDLSEENNWKHTFTGLPVVHDVKDEKAIEYTIEEVAIDNYKSTIDGDQKDGFVITNLRVGKIDIPVEKEWKNDKGYEDERPESIEVDLL